MKDNGFVLLGIPTGPDCIMFNGCRVYGHVLLSHMFANFNQTRTTMDRSYLSAEAHGWNYQPVYVVTKSSL